MTPLQFCRGLAPRLRRFVSTWGRRASPVDKTANTHLITQFMAVPPAMQPALEQDWSIVSALRTERVATKFLDVLVGRTPFNESSSAGRDPDLAFLRDLDVESIAAQALLFNEKDAVAFCELGFTAHPAALLLANGRFFSQQELFERSLNMDANNCAAWCGLGMVLHTTGSTAVVQGTTCNAQYCFYRANVLDGRKVEPYCGLGLTLPADETITLASCEVMNRKQLFVRAIELDPKNAGAFHGLAATLKRKEAITVKGHSLTKTDLLCRALELAPNSAETLLALGFLIAGSQMVHVPSVTDKPLSRRACFARAVRANPRFGLAYWALGEAIRDSGERSFTLLSGQQITTDECFKLASQLDPLAPETYLSLLMEEHETNRDLHRAVGLAVAACATLLAVVLLLRRHTQTPTVEQKDAH